MVAGPVNGYISICVYTGLLNMLQVWYRVTTHFTFCLPAGAVELVSVVLVVYSARYSSDFYFRRTPHIL